ncbi:MAG TPA: hypothetical protein VKA85_11770 [Candidatus Limnocylindrales bacterium]|nr:hypothetical protein [Candidatus Limnocylindrales bacterium]
MVMIAADPYINLEHRLTRRLRDDDTHRRIATALADVAVAAIHPGRHAQLADRVMDSFLEDPVENATRAAVETLIDELEELVDSMPVSALERLAAEQLTADLGIE